MASDDPEQLRPYLFHGIDLDYGPNSVQALGECPFCRREKTFAVVIREEKGKKFGFRCPACGKEGNSFIFIREFYQQCLADMENEEAAQKLCDSRGFLRTESVDAWGLIRSTVTAEWIVPGHNVDGALCQLYKYVQTKDGMKLLPTPTLNHYLHGMNLFDPNKSIIAICEGPWDAIALWELLGLGKWSPDGKELVPTGSVESSALADINVLAVPGCQTFHDSWAALFAGKIVWLMYDSDHPKNICGECTKTYSAVSHEACPHCSSKKVKNTLPPAGYEGVKRVATKLRDCKTPPEETQFIRWGEEFYNPTLASGTDVRDILNGKVAL